MSKRLRCLGLEADVINRLQKHNLVTCKDVLSRNYLDLVNLLNISYFTVLDIIQKASQATAPMPITALELLHSRQRVNSRAFLRTSLTLLDSVLKGGIPVSTITEVAGPSGCGKTQFCLMMAVNTMMSDENCGVIYIDTETAFSAHRLVEIAHARYPDVFGTDEALKKLASRVFVYAERTCMDLTRRLENLEDNIIEHNAKLIVVDSIASLVRKEYDSSVSRNMIERTKLLSKQAASLKFYAENYAIPVLVTNQVTTHFGHKAVAEDEPLIYDNAGVRGGAEESYVTVALGNTWSHCVNTRLILQYVDGARREILVAKSPLAPYIKCVYTIQESGIVTEGVVMQLQDDVVHKNNFEMVLRNNKKFTCPDEGTDHYNGTDPGLQMIRVRSKAATDLINA